VLFRSLVSNCDLQVGTKQRSTLRFW